jgi:hypothetical protein
MNTRKIPAGVAGLAAAATLIGLGAGAAFTDSATATHNISVGNFGCAISSTTPGIVPGPKAITLNTGPLMSSVAGTAPLAFTVTSTGNIPVRLHIAQTVPAAPFSSLLAAPADLTLNPATPTATYAAGLQWSELGMLDLGKVTSITYTATCSEVPAGPTQLDPMYLTDPTIPWAGHPNGHPAQVNYAVQYYKIFQCNYATTTSSGTVSAPSSATNGAPGSWMYPTPPATHIYILAWNDGQATPPPASACPVYQ